MMPPLYKSVAYVISSNKDKSAPRENYPQDGPQDRVTQRVLRVMIKGKEERV
jgi:hypothetical protein